MPSPIAHLATGYVTARLLEPQLLGGPETANKLRFLVFAAGVSILPDLDFVPDLLLGDLGRFHNNFSHSLAFALAMALVIGGLVAIAGRWRFPIAVGLVFCCYALHILMDYFTVGRGVMLFWPFTSERFSSPVPLFYGVRWSDGFVSHRHVWTVLSEAVFVAALLLSFSWWSRKATALRG